MHENNSQLSTQLMCCHTTPRSWNFTHSKLEIAAQIKVQVYHPCFRLTLSHRLMQGTMRHEPSSAFCSCDLKLVWLSWAPEGNKLCLTLSVPMSAQISLACLLFHCLERCWELLQQLHHQWQAKNIKVKLPTAAQLGVFSSDCLSVSSFVSKTALLPKGSHAVT